MPIVEVLHHPQLPTDRLHHLAEVLPHAVSVAVACPEEPYDGVLRPGDVDLRFRARGALDAGGLDVVVEVRTKWSASRDETRQERCDHLCEEIVRAAGTTSVGVYLSLPVAAWSQGT